MRLSLFAAALLVAAPAVAQDATPLTPSHQDLGAASMLSYETQTFDVRTTEPDQSIGTITQTVMDDGAYVVVVTEADVAQMGQTSRDSVRILKASLAADYVVVMNGDNTSQAQFDALRVVGSYGPMGRTLPIDLELKEPAFHAGGTSVSNGTALVARSLPFREGYVGTFTTFSPTRRLRDVTLTVAGREDAMVLGGGMVSAWMVEESEMPGGTVQRTYYVHPDTRDLLKITFSARGTDAVIVPADAEAMAAEAAARNAIPMIAPGDASIMASRLTAYEQSFDLKLIEPVQQDVGTTTTTVMVDEAAGRATILTVVDIPMQGSTQTDSLVVAYPSMAPIMQRASGGGATIEVMYGDDAVTGQIMTPDGETREIDVTLEDGPVFASSALGELVRTLPLAEGYTSRIMAFSPGPGVQPHIVEVTGTDEDTMGWVVAVTPEGSPATTYVIDKETRAILRSKLRPQMGVVIDIIPQD